MPNPFFLSKKKVTITIPNENWNSAETITFTATDTGDGSDLGLTSDFDQAIFTVHAVNDAPIALDVTSSTDEDIEVILFLPYSEADSSDIAESVVVSITRSNSSGF